MWAEEARPGWIREQAEMADSLRPILNKTSLSSGEAALKYTLDSPTVSCVIPGSSDPVHVKENTLASSIASIGPEIMAEIRQLWLEGRVHGTYNGST